MIDFEFAWFPGEPPRGVRHVATRTVRCDTCDRAVAEVRLFKDRQTNVIEVRRFARNAAGSDSGDGLVLAQFPPGDIFPKRMAHVIVDEDEITRGVKISCRRRHPGGRSGAVLLDEARLARELRTLGL